MEHKLVAILLTPQRWAVAKTLLIVASFYELVQLVFIPHLPHTDPHFTRETLVSATERICTLLTLGILLSYVLHTLHLRGNTASGRLALGLLWLLYTLTLLFMVGIYLLLPSASINKEPLFG